MKFNYNIHQDQETQSYPTSVLKVAILMHGVVELLKF